MWVLLLLIGVVAGFAIRHFGERIFDPVIDEENERNGTRIEWPKKQGFKQPESTRALSREIRGS